MILILVRIENLKQLRIIGGEEFSAFENSMDKIINGVGIVFRKEIVNDSIGYFSNVSEEHGSFEDRIGRVVFEIFSLLKAKEDKLFGFSVVVCLVDSVGEKVIEEIRHLLFMIDESNFLLLEKPLFKYFGSAIREYSSINIGDNIGDKNWFRVVAVEEFPEDTLNVTISRSERKNIMEKVVNTTHRERGVESEEGEKTDGKSTSRIDIWDIQSLLELVRERDVEKIMESFTPRLNWSNREQIPYIFGPVGVGKTEMVIYAANKILGKDYNNDFIRFFVSLKGSSPLHPFISGIRAYWGLKVGRVEDVEQSLEGLNLLNDVEHKIWEEKKKLFYSICNSTIDDITPDFILEDFMSIFHLFLLGFIRERKKKALPAIVIFDDIDLYHPDSRKFLRFLIRDFMGISSFLPILVTSDKVILEEFSEFNIKKVYVGPLSWRDLETIGREIVSDSTLTVSEREIKKLRRLTGGFIIPSLQCLTVLKEIGIELFDSDICEGLNFVRWIFERLSSDDRKILLDTLIAILVSYPFFLREEQVSFASSMGYTSGEIESAIKRLKRFGFMTDRGKFEPFSVELASVVESISRERYKQIESIFASHLLKMYRTGTYSNFVLLYYFFMKTGRVDVARELYLKVIERKLRERDFKGIELFLQNRFINVLKVSPLEKKVLMAIYRVWINFLSARYENAYNIYQKNEDDILKIEEASFLFPLIKGAFSNVISRLQTSLKKTKESLSIAKEVLSFSQVRGFSCDEIGAYSALGFNMLSEGRMDDAVAYFEMARYVSSAGICMEKIEAIVARGISMFIEGDIFRAAEAFEEGLKLAKGVFNRELEASILFFIGRIEFELGNYLKTVEIMEKLLAYNSVYRVLESREVCYAWLGRAFAYSGNAQIALRIFDSLIETDTNGFVSKFFRAEANYFNADYDLAVEELLDISVTISDYLKKNYRFIPGKRFVWVDGFYGIEGRVEALSSGFIERVVGSFLAYLYSLAGKFENSVEFFRGLIKDGKIPNYDPNLSWYYFLYSEVLRGMQEKMVDDRFTVLNRAWKVLQERSNKIGDFSYKKSYLEKNYWHSLIVERARESNLY